MSSNNAAPRNGFFSASTQSTTSGRAVEDVSRALGQLMGVLNQEAVQGKPANREASQLIKESLRDIDQITNTRAHTMK